MRNPGEEFWYNSAVGQRTAARGYQEAGVYEGGRTTTGIGGGICQVSSTLYYAVLLSDLDIVLRYCHMFNPGYMPIGCDATVSWGGPDFAFRNSRDYPIKIVTSYNDNTNEVTCTILGTKVDDHYVVMTNAVLGVTDYQTVYQESPDVAPGEEVIDQYGHTGYYVRPVLWWSRTACASTSPTLRPRKIPVAGVLLRVQRVAVLGWAAFDTASL